jgi:hypothetical protein
MSSDQPEEKMPMDFSNMESARKYLEAKSLVVPANWEETKKTFGTSGLEYVGGQDDMVQILREIALIEDAAELKKQLTGFLNEREDFFGYVTIGLSKNTPE